MARRAIPLEPCAAILAQRAAERPAAGPEGPSPGGSTAREGHLLTARLLDTLAARGVAVAPERLLPLLPVTGGEDSVLELLVALLADADAFAEAVREAVELRAAAARDAGLSDEAALGHAVRTALLVPAREISAYLPRAVVLSNEFRSEELVRAYAAAIDAPLEVRGAREPEERSARALERLDYRRIRDDEERLAIERSVLAEHAERVRELQRRREAEALASAQRE